MSESFSGDEYRELLRRYPTGVTVVSTSLNGRDYGATMNSFTTVSMNPPLVAVFIIKGSRTLDAIGKSRKFVVSLLSGNQEDAAVGFSRDGDEDKFLKFSRGVTSDGIAYLKDSIGRIECDLYMEEDIADHAMIIGRVTAGIIHNQNTSMVYYRRKFETTGK
ncbi:MAG: flavin reductase family protein [Candidatus Thermoplasmatota archaeon]|jgi:flavin reductase (DIM6/NTAB) family NADH-FMN oxidoreductase RutF|nr:flavin reductase family protein [Candidatus Thermoplasmatota archaeon]